MEAELTHAATFVLYAIGFLALCVGVATLRDMFRPSTP